MFLFFFLLQDPTVTLVLRTTLGIPWWPIVRANLACATTTLIRMLREVATLPRESASSACSTRKGLTVKSVNQGTTETPPPRAVWVRTMQGGGGVCGKAGWGWGGGGL